MHDARDAEDRRLLEERNHKQLLAGYYRPICERCFVRVRDEDAAREAAHRVVLRLLEELARGRTYRVPFRVVVWMVTEWTLRGFYPGAKHDASLPEGWDPEAPDAFEGWESDHDFGLLIAGLPPGQREAAELRYRDGLEPAQIAVRLGIEPNAVYQRLHNANRKLAELLGG